MTTVTSKPRIEAIYALSPMQQGMLFHSLYAPDLGMYVEQMSCSVRGDLNVSAFTRAWQQVMERHAVLRTAFVWELRDKMLQVVHQRLELPLEQHDWRDVPPAEQAARLVAYCEADRACGFNLSKAPLLRLSLIRVAEHAYYFVWTYHHLLLDGWSMPIVLKEVFTCYEAFAHGREIALARLRPYRDYIAWLQQQDLEAAEAYWRQTLAGFTAPTPLGIDPAPSSEPGPIEMYARQQTRLSRETTAALVALARQYQMTLNILVQGAWALLLSHYSGEEDVVFGMTVSGRPATLAGVESMVGLFINTLPVRVRVSPDMPLLPWLQHLQTQQIELHQYEYSPLVQVQGWSEVPRGLPLFESLLIFENYPMDASLREGSGSLAIRDVRVHERTNYPLTVVAAPEAELAPQISYDGRRFDAATITRMLGHLRTVLESMVAHPTQRLADVPLLTETERQQVLVDWNATQTEFRSQESGVRSGRSDSALLTPDSWLLTPDSWCIHQLFVSQVARTPDAVALVFAGPPIADRRPPTKNKEQRTKNKEQIGKEQALSPQSSVLSPQLTYRELNARANQLAQYLQRLGVEPEVRVGVCLERSLDLIVGVLGVLKAGGAYVPLDPSYPAERLAFMLGDSQARVLVTQHHLVERTPDRDDRPTTIPSTRIRAGDQRGKLRQR